MCVLTLVSAVHCAHVPKVYHREIRLFSFTVISMLSNNPLDLSPRCCTYLEQGVSVCYGASSMFDVIQMCLLIEEPACATPERFIMFFCVRGKVGGGTNRLLRDESFESCLTVLFVCLVS